MPLNIELKNEQKLTITPMLQHALKILQLPTLELANLVRDELAENPMLEEKESDEVSPMEVSLDTDGEMPALETGNHTSEVTLDAAGVGPLGFDMEEWNRHFSDDGYEIPKYEQNSQNELPEVQVTRSPSLEEHLLWQLRLVSKTEDEFHLGELIIGNLDDRGFLSQPVEDIAREAEVETEKVEDALALVQTLEPSGIAARNVIESLLIQLRNLPERNVLAERIVERHFEALERRQVDKIAKAEKTTREAVLAAVTVIAGLDPFPGRHQFSDSVEYVIPDVVVEKHDDDYIILVKDDSLPELKISRTYRQMLRQRGEMSEETKHYLEEKLQKAIWLIRSIEQRRKTLYRVMETIVDVQKEFFEKGVEFLRPLTLREIAERVSLHESTISRVTSRKYAQTPRGVFELKYFFSSQLKTSDGGEISSTSVKAALAEQVSQEEPKHPFSDQRLTSLLNQRGFQIARRTVAKYREELNILPASRRRRLE
ncbi:MAG: RNA polymerase factor sigma-54 [Candidatus Firestonebacteria bacterium]|nr:RNA polymerase factor sigma-54 [Candidatus Firestonebacteria bacterium]